MATVVFSCGCFFAHSMFGECELLDFHLCDRHIADPRILDARIRDVQAIVQEDNVTIL